MKEVFQEASNQLQSGHSVVVATVVRTKGSTPQKSGAKLLVRKDGSGVGTLGGGCVEGDIWFTAKELMKRGKGAQHQEYQLNEALAAQDGLVCGGNMYFLIDPIYKPDQYLDFVMEIGNAYEGGPSVALASLTKASADNSAPIGAKLFIRENGTTQGTLGSKESDNEASKRAVALMTHGRNEYVIAEDGTEFFVEAFTSPPQLILCGGGHVSKAIADLSKTLEFRLFVTDDREEFANENRFPEADMLVMGNPESALHQLPINPNTFIVVATRGHRYDSTALETAARTPAKYVGLLGSKRKAILIYEDLMKHGLSIERIKEIRCPIGLDIHAKTPSEIALSVIAEILMYRLGGTGVPMKLEEWRIDRIAEKLKKSADIIG